MYQNMAILGAFVFIYSIVSGRIEKTFFSGAALFIVFGLGIGPFGLGILDIKVDAGELSLLAELTLALVLFTDAANANLGVLRRNFHIPQRLLLIGLPLTILLGFVFGFLLFGGLTLIEVAILATMLAPTDAALGKAVVSDKAVPPDIRESLNMESGLNDGICVPILFLFLALAADSRTEGRPGALALKLVAEAIGIGALTGIVITVLGSWLLRFFSGRGWISETWQQLPIVALAVTCFAVAQRLGGSGFIASFVGGLLFGALTRHHKSKLLLAAEGTGDTLALITWVLFGAAVIGKTAGFLTWQTVVYSLLSLTVIRILPVLISLVGMPLRTDEKMFIGWFGPRGLASIVFAVIVLDDHLPGGNTIVVTAACTIIMSVVAHGLSANPLVAVLAGRLKKSDR